MTMVAGLFIVFLLSYMVTSTQKMQKLFSNPFMINGKNKLMYVRDIYILHMLRTFIVKFFLDLSFTFYFWCCCQKTVFAGYRISGKLQNKQLNWLFDML